MCMSKAKLLIPLAVSIVLAGCTNKNSTINITPTSTTAEKAAASIRLGKIIESGGNAACTIADLTSKTETQMFVSGKKMKIVGISGASGEKASKGVFLNDGAYTYMWEEGKKEGYKYKVQPTPSVTPEKSQIGETNPSSQDYAKSYEDESKYKIECKQGAATDADFTAPKDVKFIDPTELMKNIPSIPAVPSLKK